MTVLALNGKSLDLREKPGRHLPRGLIRSTLGHLEWDRLRLVLAQAQQAGIKGTIPEVLRDQRLIQVLSRQFKVPMPSTDACQRYYRDHLESFRSAERYLGRQIVLRCPKGDPIACAESWARAERLIAILFFDPKMFDDLIATYDSASHDHRAGRIGPVEPSALPPALEVALLGLKPGQIYPAPVTTDEGIHVLMLDRILPGEVAPFAAVHGQISAILRNELRTAATRRHLARLAQRYQENAAE